MGVDSDIYRAIRYGQVNNQVGKISQIFNYITFYKRLIADVKISITYQDYIDEMRHEAFRVVTKDRNYKIRPKEVTRNCNIDLKTTKETSVASNQHVVCTAIHPLTSQVCVDNLN